MMMAAMMIGSQLELLWQTSMSRAMHASAASHSMSSKSYALEGCRNGSTHVVELCDATEKAVKTHESPSLKGWQSDHYWARIALVGHPSDVALPQGLWVAHHLMYCPGQCLKPQPGSKP